MGIQDDGGGYFICDKCNYWGLCVRNLEGEPHSIKRHVSPTRLEELIADRALPPLEDLRKLRTRAREGSLAIIQICGTFQRIEFEEIQQRLKG